MPESSVWKRMMKLEKLQNVNIISDSKYSVVSIVNWDIYNPFQKKGDSKGDKEVTSKEQARNTEKNDKNYKNVKKEKELLAVEKIPEKDIEIEIPLVDKTMFQITRFDGVSPQYITMSIGCRDASNQITYVFSHTLIS